MPYVEGESLRERLDRDHQLPVDEAVGIATNMAEALDYAHGQGVIHRDIKPANVLMLSGKPVISDFGIALAVGAAGGGRLTETGLSLGTPHYMSPEQATGDQNVGPQTDTYALGCVLYEMLVGEAPYTGPNAQAVLGQIITAKAVSATEKRASVPANVDAAIRSALEKVPADRFTAMQDFARAMADSGFRHGEEGLAAEITGRRLWNPLQIATTGVALVFALGFAWLLLRPEPARNVTRLELAVSDTLTPARGVGLAFSPDGTRIAFGAVSSGGTTRLYLRELTQLSSNAIPGTEDASNPRFSPDGQSLAFTGEGRLRTVLLTGSPPVTLVPDSVPSANAGLAWGPDGMIYFRKLNRGIWRVSETGGEAEEVTTLSPRQIAHAWPEVLPNGRAILLTALGVSNEVADVTVLSLETGELRPLFRGRVARYAESGHIVYTSNDGTGTLLAAPFDAGRLEVTGPSRAILEGRAGARYFGDFALSESGHVVYRWSGSGGAAMGGAGAGGVPVWVGRDGSEQLLDPTLTGSFGDPAVSPDGRKVAFEHTAVGGGTENIWIYDMDQGTFSRFTFESRNIDPFWSPDGSEVGFSSDRAGFMALYARPADLSGEVRLLVADPDDGLYSGSWTPDARQLVYRRGSAVTTGNTALLYAAPEPDSTPVVVVDTPAVLFHPSISPDGRWFAYSSNESGRREVYVRPFPGPGGRVQVSVDGGQRPAWPRNGREIFYRAADGSWVVATVRTDPDFAVESRERFGSPGMGDSDVSPDGQRAMTIRRDPGDTQDRDIIWLNFFEELRQVTPD